METVELVCECRDGECRKRITMPKAVAEKHYKGIKWIRHKSCQTEPFFTEDFTAVYEARVAVEGPDYEILEADKKTA